MSVKRDDLIAIYNLLWKCKITLKNLVLGNSSKDIIYGLIFIKLASYSYNKRRNELIDLFGKGSVDVENKSMYFARNIFYVNEKSEWKYLLDNMDSESICEIIENALTGIENDNRSLIVSTPKEAFNQFKGNENEIKNLMLEIDKVEEEESMNGGNLITVMRVIQRTGNYMF